MPKINLPLDATKVKVVTRLNGNGAASSGSVTFSDGVCMDFYWDFGDKIYQFTSHKDRNRRLLTLPKRERALNAALNDGKNVETLVIRVSR